MICCCGPLQIADVLNSLCGIFGRIAEQFDIYKVILNQYRCSVGRNFSCSALSLPCGVCLDARASFLASSIH